MLSSTLTVTINGVGKVLSRVNDSEPYSSTYFLQESTTDYTLNVKHTIPAIRGVSKESHLVRLDVVDYDTDDSVLRKQSVWTVLETSVGKQEATDQGYNAAGLFALLDTTMVANILARES